MEGGNNMNNELTTREYICKYIDTWLANHKVSTNKFAIAIGVTACSVKRWRTGECAPDLNLFKKISDYMDVPINELLGFESISKLTPKQTEILYKYAHDTNFKKLIDSYHDDDEIRVTLDTLIRRMK